MKICKRCKVEDGDLASIEEHHINGDHNDNRPENKMNLCANCHATLHKERWKLSDIGMPDIVLPSRVLGDRLSGIVSEAQKFKFSGYDSIQKTASKMANGAHIYVPKKWAGKKIITVLMENDQP